MFQDSENICLEFTHEELYSFYDQVGKRSTVSVPYK